MVRQISVRDLAMDLENEQSLCLLDVRQPAERALAALPNSILIPLGELQARVRELDEQRGQRIVVYCHHGGRSLHAAHFLSQLGFAHVENLAGGIDAWSLEVDPTVPRY